MRADLALLIDVSVAKHDPTIGWEPGVVEYTYADRGREVRTTKAARATNFPPALRRYLYAADDDGDIGFETRFRRTVFWEVGSTQLAELGANFPGTRLTVTYVELLRSVSRLDASSSLGVMAVLAQVEAPDVATLTELVEWLSRVRGKDAPASPRGANAHRLLRQIGILGGFAKTDGVPGLASESTVYPVVLYRTDTSDGDLTDRDHELYAVAAAHRPDTMHSSPERVAEHSRSIERLSRTWSALVLRHGAAYQLHCPPETDFVPLATVYFRTLHVDALMLARLQGLLVRELEQDLRDVATADGPRQGSMGEVLPGLETLDRELTLATVRYSMLGLISNSGKAVDLVRRFHEATGFEERRTILAQNVETLVALGQRDRARTQSRAQHEQQLSQERLAEVVTVFGTVAIPVTVAIDLFSLLETGPGAGMLLALAVIAVLLGVATWTLLRRFLH